MLLASFLLTAMASSFQDTRQIFAPPAPASTRAMPGIAPSATGREVDLVRRSIRKGRDKGQLSRRQSKDLRVEARELSGLEERYARDGLSESERVELRNRVEVLRAITNAKRIGSIK